MRYKLPRTVTKASKVLECDAISVTKSVNSNANLQLLLFLEHLVSQHIYASIDVVFGRCRKS